MLHIRDWLVVVWVSPIHFVEPMYLDLLRKVLRHSSVASECLEALIKWQVPPTSQPLQSASQQTVN